MAKRYIAVDAGKYAVKSCSYDKVTDTIRKFTCHTKISEGDFRDDALERNTFIVEVDGKVYKIGNGARGNGAELETNKMTDIHRICTMFAIAQFCSSNEVDEVNVAIGLPAKEWANVDKRENYKEFMFPTGEVSVTIKNRADGFPEERKFIIKNKFVFPESIGALFQDDSPELSSSSLVGVLDIGSLNLNATCWNGHGELIIDDSITDELGGTTLVQGLAQELTSNFSRCSESLVAQIVRQRPEGRCLVPTNGDETIKEESRKLIAQYLLNHAKSIKRCCDGRKWSLDYMKIIAIGGTSTILKEELKEVFGENITILNCPTFANAYGFLRMMCSRLPEIGGFISLNEDTGKNEKTQNAKKAG